MHIILTGATGVVGSAILHHILNDSASAHITKLTLLSRNPSIPLLTIKKPPSTLQINVVPHQDFLTYSPILLTSLSSADALIWALGISQTEVSTSDYVTITRDYTLAAAKAFGSNPARYAVDDDNGGVQTRNPFKFIFISGEGATTTPNLFTPLYGRVKGETEAALLALNASAECPHLRVFSARPGAVDSSADPAVVEATRGKRQAGLKRLEPYVLPVMRRLGPGLVTPTRELGKVLTDLAVGGGERVGEGRGVSGEGRTLANVKLREIGGW